MSLEPAEQLRRTEGAIADLTRRIKRALKHNNPVDHQVALLARFEHEAARLRAQTET